MNAKDIERLATLERLEQIEREIESLEDECYKESVKERVRVLLNEHTELVVRLTRGV